MHSCRVLRVQGMFINDQVIVFIFCIPYEQVLIWTTTILWLTTMIMHQETICNKTYLLYLNASYVVVFTAHQTGWNILLRMSFHNIQKPVPIFVHGRDPHSSWQKFLIQFNHLWSSSKMEQGTNLSFLASHRTSPCRHYS